MSTTQELKHLDRIASDSWYARGVNAQAVKYSFHIFSRFIRGETILELGPAEGIMTPLLASLGKRLTMVEGALKFCEDLRKRFPDANVVHSLFENFRSREQFDNIILGHVMEHVQDPTAVLRLVRSWLNPGGRVLAAVPNARSLHRQAAVIMGLLPYEDAMNENDIHHGHRRVFNPETFRNAFLMAGYHIELFGGYWIKPVSNRQIEEAWTPEMIEAFMRLGERYPDIAGELYIVAGHPPS